MKNKLERELRDKLKSEERKNKWAEIHESPGEKYVDAAILFFGTLGPLYLLFFIAYQTFMFWYGTALGFVSVSLEWVLPIIHGLIWAASVYSVYRKRSILNDMMKWL